MPGITERQTGILEQIIQEYIETARPVSSHSLKEKAGFCFCPATIRNEMQKLTEEGYLEQPHTSAGRIPTDTAYRFFINQLKEIDCDKEFFQQGRKTIKHNEDFLGEVQTVLKKLSLFSLKFTLTYFSEKKIFLKEGWEEIFAEPEFKNVGYCRKFLKMIKGLDHKINNFVFQGENDIKVYIGRENPLFSADEFSIIASACFFPSREKGILLIAGPKRMAYKKTIGLMRSAVKLIHLL